MNAHDRFAELAVGHALNALEPGDESIFLAHLPGCSACGAALVEHRDTLGHLSYAVRSDEPPPALLQRIRAGVAADGTAPAPAPEPPAAPAPVIALATRRSRTVKLTTALVGVAASVVLVAALLLTNLNLSSRNSDLRLQEAALQRTASSFLTPGAERIGLSGVGEAVAVLHGGKVDLVLSGVPANPRNTTYVLWEQNASGVKAAGTFDVTSDGLHVISRGLRVDGSVSALMVSREPCRVAPAAASDVLLQSRQ